MISETTEVSYYAKIMNKLVELEDEPNKKDIWKSKSIIQLMDLSKEIEDDEFTQKALVNILTIYNILEDSKHNCDKKHLEKLSECEKEKVISLLKEEIN